MGKLCLYGVKIIKKFIIIKNYLSINFIEYAKSNKMYKHGYEMCNMKNVPEILISFKWKGYSSMIKDSGIICCSNSHSLIVSIFTDRRIIKRWWVWKSWVTMCFKSWQSSMINVFNEVMLLATDVGNTEPNLGQRSILSISSLQRLNVPEKFINYK